MRSSRRPRARKPVRISDIIETYPHLQECSTGGGGYALTHPLVDGGFILITKCGDGMRVPGKRDRRVECGVYDRHGVMSAPDQKAEVVELAELDAWITLQLGLACSRKGKGEKARRPKLPSEIRKSQAFFAARVHLGSAIRLMGRCKEALEDALKDSNGPSERRIKRTAANLKDQLGHFFSWIK